VSRRHQLRGPGVLREVVGPVTLPLPRGKSSASNEGEQRRLIQGIKRWNAERLEVEQRSWLPPPCSTPTSLTVAEPAKGLLWWATASGIQQYAPGTGAATLIETPVRVGQPTLDEVYFYWINGSGLYRWPRQR
jgi:hypothetical protein